MYDGVFRNRGNCEVRQELGPASEDDVVFDMTHPQRPLGLDDGDGVHCVRAADYVFGQADVLDLPFLH